MNYILMLSNKISGGVNTRTSKVFLFFNIILSVVLGAALWAVIRIFAGNSIIGLICTVGYIVVFYGMLGGILYLMNKDLW